MFAKRGILFFILLSTDVVLSSGLEIVTLTLPHHHVAHKAHSHKYRRHRATNDGALRFEPDPYSKKLELGSAGKIHCKVAGGVAPTVQWFANQSDPLPEGVTSVNGTLTVAQAAAHHAGSYTCRAREGDSVIEATVTVDVVVSPQILEPLPGAVQHVSAGGPAWVVCRAAGSPPPTTHWDRNRTVLSQQDGVDVEGGANASNARILLLNNGTLFIRKAAVEDSDTYGCTAGSAAGLARSELTLIVHPEGEILPSQESSGVAGKAVIVSISVAGAYMILVLALMVYCRRRRLARRQRGEKMELEMVEGREKLVEDGEEKKVGNGAPNGRLLQEKDSGADNSEVSGISRASKRSAQLDRLAVPRTLLNELVTLGRGEFGEVFLAKIDMTEVKKLRDKDANVGESKIRPVLVKALTTKDETQLAEFRRQLDLFSRVRSAHIARFIALCTDTQPHYMLLEHTDWGDLKNFLIATRTPEETQEYQAKVGSSYKVPTAPKRLPPLGAHHRLVLAAHLANAADCLATLRFTHRDIAARNCAITSQLHLKLSYPALTRGPDSHEYYKLHNQVVPLRWMPAEAVLEGEHSTKSDVYAFAATVWEIYTKAELPFAKLNDNSVLERLKNNSLEWNIPTNMPDRLAALLKRCWSVSPTERPQFTEICEEINAILKDVTSENLSMHSQDREGQDA